MAVTLEAVDYQAEDAVEKFVKSLHETGFDVVKNHPISQDTVNSIYKNWYDYFTTGDKYEYLRNPETQDGYFPLKNLNLPRVWKFVILRNITIFIHEGVALKDYEHN